MNKWLAIGNLTKDPEKRTTQQGTSVTSFTIACQRKFKNASGTYDADFINCVAWRQTADFIAQYFKRGDKIAVEGSIQSRDYDKDGKRVYVTEANIDGAEFVGSKPKEDKAQQTQLPVDELAEFAPLDDADLPF